MGRNYSVSGNATNTASATLPLLTLISAASIRPKIYDLQISSDAAPADHAAKYLLQRCTTAGTPGSSLTPQALDPADPSAALTSGLAIFSAGPTLTANALLLAAAVNQRIPYRWVAKDGKELVLPATAANGLALLCTVVDSAFNTVMCAHFEE